MVKDKINYRARGPNTMLTRQSVQGRANDGGLRIGEMERDGILAHGCAGFLNESYLIRGDEYFMAVCNKTGGIAVYNQAMNLFLSPFADGPIKFNTALDGKMNIQNVSRFGRSFSIVRIPYALKLLIQELQVLNIQMRIITEDNIDQLMSMSYSDNINKLLQDTENTDLKMLVSQYSRRERDRLYGIQGKLENDPFENPAETPVYNKLSNMYLASPQYQKGSPAYQPGSSEEMEPMGERNPNSPVYDPNSPPYAPGSPAYQPGSNEEMELGVERNSNSSPYAPGSPAYQPGSSEEMEQGVERNSNSPVYNPYSPMSSPPSPKITNPELKAQWESLSESDKKTLAEMLDKKRAQSTASADASTNASMPVTGVPSASILNVEEKKLESGDKSADNSTDQSTDQSNPSETKEIKFDVVEPESSGSNSNETKKIIL